MVKLTDENNDNINVQPILKWPLRFDANYWMLLLICIYKKLYVWCLYCSSVVVVFCQFLRLIRRLVWFYSRTIHTVNRIKIHKIECNRNGMKRYRFFFLPSLSLWWVWYQLFVWDYFCCVVSWLALFLYTHFASVLSSHCEFTVLFLSAVAEAVWLFASNN